MKKTPNTLCSRIISRIRHEEVLRSVRRRFSLFAAIFAASFISLAALLPMLRTELAASEFLQFLNLVLTDTRAILINWQEFGLALLEAFPVNAALIFLSTSLLLLWSFKHLTQLTPIVYES